MKLQLKIVFLFFITCSTVFAQLEDGEADKPVQIITNRIMTRSVGLVVPVYRDFATSPLFYRGVGMNLGYGWLNTNFKRDRLFEMNLNGSVTLANTPRSDYYQTQTAGFLVSSNVYYHYLHRIEKLSSEKMNFKLGGAINGTQNIRVNPRLFNAALGLESILNLMVAGRLNRDISRTENKKIKFLFIEKTLLPIKRHWDFQANVGVLNFNRRPSYAYVYKEEWDGTDTNPALWIMEPYNWSMNGWRLGTRVEYSWFRPSGNGRKWAYIWDAAHVPGRFESFQMASHTLQYAIIINNNKR